MKSIIILLAILATTASTLAADPQNGSWNKKPSWASTETNQPSKKADSSPRENSRYAVSPFSTGSNNVAVEVGQIFLMGDLGSDYSSNLGTSLMYTYGVSDIFAFDSSLAYSTHSEGNFSMTALQMGLRTNLSWYDKIIPYFSFGLGFYRPSYQITPTSTLNPVLFGLHLGPGVDLQVTNRLFFGTSLKFHNMFGMTKTTANGPKDVGGSYISLMVHAGVTF